MNFMYSDYSDVFGSIFYIIILMNYWKMQLKIQKIYLAAQLVFAKGTKILYMEQNCYERYISIKYFLDYVHKLYVVLHMIGKDSFYQIGYRKIIYVDV